jgi:hypothetical protein
MTVLESEMTALRLLQKVIEQDVSLPVNYCSFVYKRRYQQAATRRRNARSIIKGYESITENGFIRSMILLGGPEILGKQAEELDRMGMDPERWTINTKKDRLHFHETLWPLIDWTACRLIITYAEAVLCPTISYHCAFKEVRLESGHKIYIEKRPVRIDLSLDTPTRLFFENTVVRPSNEPSRCMNLFQEEILRYEFIQPGLQDYF